MRVWWPVHGSTRHTLEFKLKHTATKPKGQRGGTDKGNSIALVHNVSRSALARYTKVCCPFCSDTDERLPEQHCIRALMIQGMLANLAMSPSAAANPWGLVD